MMGNNHALLAIWAVMLFICMHIVSAACTEPISGMQITQDTELCQGRYVLSDGLKIAADGIKLFCHDTIIANSEREEGYGIFTSSKSSVQIIGCTIEDFQVGIFMIDVSDSVVSQNRLLRNTLGMSLVNSQDNDINDNTIVGSSLQGMAVSNSAGNRIYSNYFSGKGFDITYRGDGNSFCSDGKANAYEAGAVGPGCVDLIAKADAGDDPAGTISGNQEPGSAADSTLLDNGSFEIEITPIQSRLAKEILREALAIEGIMGEDLILNTEELSEQHDDVMPYLSIDKKLMYDKRTDTTKIRTIITADTRIKDLFVYEAVPKCVAQSFAEIIFLYHEPERVIRADPLFVWHFADVEEGQVLDLSYRVKGKVIIRPATVAVTGGGRALSADGSQRLCADEEEPISVPVGKPVIFGNIAVVLPIIVLVLFALFYVTVNVFRKK